MRSNIVSRLFVAAVFAAGAAGLIQCGGSSSSPTPATTTVATTTTAPATTTAATTTSPATTSTVSIRANFDVNPDNGTAVSAGQCSAAQVTGTATQRLLCTFDASSSTPAGAITEYRWSLPGAADMTTSSPRLTDPPIPCGGFSSAGTEKSVTLRVTAPGGSDTVTKAVTFVKGSPC